MPVLSAEQTEIIAQAAHEMNRVWCLAHGDTSQDHWEAAEEWQRQSAVAGVSVALAGATPADQHNAWMADKTAAGWVYGPVKDADTKQHPCMVPYALLPEHQRAKDVIYVRTVLAFAAAFGGAS